MGQLATFTSSTQESLSDLQNRLSQLYTLHRDAQDRLRAQVSDLLEGHIGQRFSGLTALEFDQAITQYIQTSEKLMQQIETLEQGARACISNLEGAAEIGERLVMNENLVYRVLSEVDLDRLLSFGEGVIEDAVEIVSVGLHDLLTRGVVGVAEDLLDDLPGVRHVLTYWGAEVHHAVQAFLRLVEEARDQFALPVLGVAPFISEKLGYSKKLTETLEKEVLKLLRRPGELADVGEKIPVVDIVAGVFATIIDISHQQQRSPKTIAAAIIGNGLLVGVGLFVPGADIAIAADAAIQIYAQFQADLAGQGPEAERYQIMADNTAKLGDAFDDIGSLVIDTLHRQSAPAILGSDALFSSPPVWGPVDQDFKKLWTDISAAVLGPTEVIESIQNEPLANQPLY